jgi:hypothetical protein
MSREITDLGTPAYNEFSTPNPTRRTEGRFPRPGTF